MYSLIGGKILGLKLNTPDNELFIYKMMDGKVNKSEPMTVGDIQKNEDITTPKGSIHSGHESVEKYSIKDEGTQQRNPFIDMIDTQP